MKFLRHFLLVAVFCSGSNNLRAQLTDTVFSDFTFKQDSMPFSDSGHWVSCLFDFTNSSSTPLKLDCSFEGWNGGPWGFDTVDHNGEPPTDSIITVPAHSHDPDVQIRVFFIDAVPDTIHSTMQILASFGHEVKLIGRGDCPVPVWGLGYYDYTDSCYQNSDDKVIPGQTSFTWSDAEGYYASRDFQKVPLQVSLAITGEYSDRFLVSQPTWVATGIDTLEFLGAPKSLVHDTLIMTSTNCLGSLVTRTPVNAWSHYPVSHKTRLVQDTVSVPFLDHATQQLVVTNITIGNLVMKDISVSSQSAGQFTLLSPSSGSVTIPPNDSTVITIDVKDLPQLDLTGNTQTAKLTAKFEFENDPEMIDDSDFETNLVAKINVYSPEYLSLVPLIEDGVRPAGIIFRASRASFTTFFANDNNETYVMAPPYFDDTNFAMTTTPQLPQPVVSEAFIQASTDFHGNTNKNYRTQLHWPRKRQSDGLGDLISMDVLAVGDVSALGVNNNPNLRSSFHLWPNPASTFLQVSIDGVHAPAPITITDILGRTVANGWTNNEGSELDISKLPPGTYCVRIPLLNQIERLEISR